MNIYVIASDDPRWLPAAAYAETCSWDACARMAAFMREGRFTDGERLFVAEENGILMGFCALMQAQGFPGPEYAPLVKWIFVEEKYRGKRLSQKLIDRAAAYAKETGCGEIFLTTWHRGLYEKYGFVKICDKEVRAGYFEGIYGKKIT